MDIYAVIIITRVKQILISLNSVLNRFLGEKKIVFSFFAVTDNVKKKYVACDPFARIRFNVVKM